MIRKLKRSNGSRIKARPGRTERAKRAAAMGSRLACRMGYDYVDPGYVYADTKIRPVVIARHFAIWWLRNDPLAQRIPSFPVIAIETHQREHTGSVYAVQQIEADEERIAIAREAVAEVEAFKAEKEAV